MKAFISIFASVLLCTSAVASSGSDSLSAKEIQFRAWINDMKSAPRGPFSRIRWFCKDGTILEPKAYACQPHGGGVQHGEWNEQTLEMRDNGFFVANVLAGLDEAEFVQQAHYKDQYNQILIEQFLIAFDDGWVLRKARSYRGALQEEDERRGARRLLTELAKQPRWRTTNYPALRTGARLLRHGEETASVTKVRQLSANLSNKDSAFGTIRNKIHVRPDASDAGVVRRYASGVSDRALRLEYEQLASLIDNVYTHASSAEALRELAKQSAGDDLKVAAESAANSISRAHTDTDKLTALGGALRTLRDAVKSAKTGAAALSVIGATLRLEDDFYTLGAKLVGERSATSRSQQLHWLRASADAMYGAGLLSERQRLALHEALQSLAGESVRLSDYKASLDYLALAPAWGGQRLRFHFFDSMSKLARVEPKSHLFIQDLLRGSPLFFYANVLDGLLRDANELAGIDNQLFGQQVGSGLRALNPGLARGTLYLGEKTSLDDYQSNGIYLLPETVSDLPPVAGILTAGEGNPLSHVQLLARNLGIPNVGVDESLRPLLEAHQGSESILAVSPAGTVKLIADSPELAALFKKEKAEQPSVLIRPDLEKLDLTLKEFVRLSELRASDSGRVVGPKAAKLGELLHHYPEAVAEGLTIPFGIFKDLLDQPYKDTGKSVFEWMVAKYRHFETLPAGSGDRQSQTEAFRAALYDWIVNADPGDSFRQDLTQALRATFGEDGSYGVFVRSDTNVEDLPGFTGAGLNLTVANVVGVDEILRAIPKVWASPFTARAFAWRQSHMDQPEHVYPAVLLMLSVPAEKSGVLVTQDVDSGDRQILSVAVNEGVGGAVDGQAAESLRIHMQTGKVKLLAEATAPIRRIISATGGVDKVPVSDAEAVLTPSEIEKLITLAKELPNRFPSIVDAAGNSAPADIEFGFLGGDLRLFQIRPFLESAHARSSAFLKQMDAQIKDLDNVTVSLMDTVEKQK